MDIANVFWSGRSQAVRLPKAYRFDAAEVQIRRQGRSVILEPIGDERDWAWLDALVGPVDKDFARAVEDELPMQERPEIDAFFNS
jgi:antitoxin VapB